MTNKLTNALDECLVVRRSRLKGKNRRTAQLIKETPQAVPSSRAKAAGLERLLMAVKLKKQSRQAQQEVLPEAA